MTRSVFRACCLPLLAALLGGCAAPGKPLGEWIAPDYSGEPARRLLVVAAHERSTRRRAFEDYLVASLKAAGADAGPSYALLAASLKLSRGALEQGIARGGFDAVLVLALTPVDPDQPYGAPSPRGAGAFFAYHDRVFDAASGRPRRAPTAIETSLFDARGGRLVWSMRSAVMEPSQPRDFIEAHLAAVVERLRRAGLLAIDAGDGADAVPGAD